MAPKDPHLPTLYSLYEDHVLKSYRFHHRISLTPHNLAELHVDAIVTPARYDLKTDQENAVDYNIRQAAGSQLSEECKKVRTCAYGKAVITPGCKLPAKYLIHAVGPRYNSTHEKESATQLKDCYDHCFKLAIKHDIKTIAFPLLATGKNGSFPMEDVIRIALLATRRFLSSSEGEKIELVAFVTGTDREKKKYRELVTGLFPK